MNGFRGETEINIGGEKRLVKFNLNATATFCEVTGKPLHEITFHVGDVRDLLWAGLKEGARIQGKPFDVDNYTVGDWIDDMEQAEFEKVNNALLNSNPAPSDDPKAKKK